jgi:hypothetical protein
VNILWPYARAYRADKVVFGIFIATLMIFLCLAVWCYSLGAIASSMVMGGGFIFTGVMSWFLFRL